MEVQTKTKQIAELADKFVGEFEKDKNDSEEVYQALRADLDVALKRKEESYIEAVKATFSTALQKAIERKEIVGLEHRVCELQGEFPTSATLEERRKIGFEYNSQITSTYEKAANSISPLFEQWIKEFASSKTGEAIDWEEVRKKEKTLASFKDKKIRRARQKDPGFDSICEKEEKRLTEEINKVYEKKANYESLQRHQLGLPILLHEINDNGSTKIKVALPLHKGPSNIEVADGITNLMKGLGVSYSENPDEYLLNFSIDLNGGESSEIKTRLKEKLDSGIRSFGYNLDPKIYSTYVELFSVKQQPEAPKIEVVEIRDRPKRKGKEISDLVGQPSVPEEELVSIKEAGKLCGFHPTNFYYLKKAGVWDFKMVKKKNSRGRIESFVTKQNINDFRQRYIKTRAGWKIKEGYEGKKEASRGSPEKMVPASETGIVEKLINRGAHYIAEHFDAHGKLPAEKDWDSRKINREEVAKYWKSIPQFIKEALYSEEGITVRKNIESRLSVDRLSVNEIAERIGLSENTVHRDLDSLGVLTYTNLHKYYHTLEKLRTKQIIDFSKFDKDEIREKMLLNGIIDGLSKPERINYFGLEGPNFGSLVYISQLCKIDSQRSVVAEFDSRAYNAMKSIITHREAIKGGELFDGLKLFYGDINYAVADPKYADFKFNVVNLDYNGCLDDKKLGTMRDLFEKKKFADEAVLFVTLSEQGRVLPRLKTDFGSDDQLKVTRDVIYKEAAKAGYAAEMTMGERYVSRRSKMISTSFKLKRGGQAK